MKKIALLMIVSLAIVTHAQANSPATVILDGGVFYYAYEPEDARHPVPLYCLKNVPDSNTEKLFLPVSLIPFYVNPEMTLQFPLAWSVKDNIPCACMGDLRSDSLGRINILLCFGAFPPEGDKNIVDEISLNQNTSPNVTRIIPGFVARLFISGRVQYRKMTSLTREAHWLPQEASQFGGASGMCTRSEARNPGPLLLETLEKSAQVPLWFSLDGSNMLARLPISRMGRNEAWCLYVDPVAFRWMECTEQSVLSKMDVPVYGFNPIGSVRIYGRKLLTDDKSISYNTDADWLIWEKNTNGVVRLCQMKGGRWSPVREVPRAPQTIVVDNDTETVHLLYDFAIDRADIDGSLRRLASLLKPPQSVP